MHKKGSGINLKVANGIVVAAILIVALTAVALRLNLFAEKPQMTAVSSTGWPDTLRVATDRDYKPYSYIDEQGRPQGYDVELITILADRMHMNLDLQMLQWRDAIDAMNAGGVDVLMTSDYTDSFDGVGGMLKSEPTSMDEFVIWSKKHISSLDDVYSLRNAIMRQGNVTSTVGMLHLDCVEYDDNRAAMQAVTDGDADCAIMRNTIGTVLLDEIGDFTVRACASLAHSYMCFEINADNPVLASRIDATLEALKNEGVLEDLSDKWLTPFVRPDSTEDTLMNIIWVLLALIALGVVIVSQVISRRKQSKSEQLIESYSKTYRTVFTIDLSDGSYTVMKQEDVPVSGPMEFSNFRQLADYHIRNMVYPPDKTKMREEMAFDTIHHRLQEKPAYGVLYRMIIGGVPTWFEMVFTGMGGDLVAMGVRNRDQETITAQIGNMLRENYMDIYLADLDTDNCRVIRSQSSFLGDDAGKITGTVALKKLASTLSGADKEFFEGLADCEKFRHYLSRDGKIVYLYPSPNYEDGQTWVRFEAYVLNRSYGRPQTAMIGITLVDSAQKERMIFLRSLAEKVES